MDGIMDLMMSSRMFYTLSVTMGLGKTKKGKK